MVGTMTRLASVIALLLMTGTARAQSRQDVLGQAREAYNAQRYDEAIRLAGQARAVPALSAPAAVVLARASLERYRQTAQPADLVTAREALRTVAASALEPRDQVELLVAVGISLYLDEDIAFGDRFSAAAEAFEGALGRAGLLDPNSRDLLFEWWAGSLDRQAQQGPESGRRVVYARVLAAAEKALAADVAAVSASYWLAAAARGCDDLSRAVGAAAAGWIRAGSMGARGAILRADLDRLMVQVVLPERARELAPGADPRPVFAQLESQWRDLKQKWGG